MSSQAATPNLTSPTIKRKPGRPRKDGLPPQTKADNSDPTTKRKGGRPKKKYRGWNGGRRQRQNSLPPDSLPKIYGPSKPRIPPAVIRGPVSFIHPPHTSNFTHLTSSNMEETQQAADTGLPPSTQEVIRVRPAPIPVPGSATMDQASDALDSATHAYSLRAKRPRVEDPAAAEALSKKRKLTPASEMDDIEGSTLVDSPMSQQVDYKPQNRSQGVQCRIVKLKIRQDTTQSTTSPSTEPAVTIAELRKELAEKDQEIHQLKKRCRHHADEADKAGKWSYKYQERAMKAEDKANAKNKRIWELEDALGEFRRKERRGGLGLYELL